MWLRYGPCWELSIWRFDLHWLDYSAWSIDVSVDRLNVRAWRWKFQYWREHFWHQMWVERFQFKCGTGPLFEAMQRRGVR